MSNGLLRLYVQPKHSMHLSQVVYFMEIDLKTFKEKLSTDEGIRYRAKERDELIKTHPLPNKSYI